MILQNGRPAGLSLTHDNKALRVWPCMLEQKAKSQHEQGATCWGERAGLESKCACPFLTHVAAHVCNSLSLSVNAVFVKHTTEIKHHTGRTKKCMGTKSSIAKARYTEYQNAALALQHEWCFSRSTFRWEEQEMSAGWFSASISYKRGHFSLHRMTYEGTAAAFISILLWGMVAKVSLYLL